MEKVILKKDEKILKLKNTVTELENQIQTLKE